MLIIYGTKDFRRVKGKTAKEMHCQNCGMDSQWKLTNVWTWFSLYYIPFISSVKKENAVLPELQLRDQDYQRKSRTAERCGAEVFERQRDTGQPCNGADQYVCRRNRGKIMQKVRRESGWADSRYV